MDARLEKAKRGFSFKGGVKRDFEEESRWT
jgi:hypothetical protein